MITNEELESTGYNAGEKFTSPAQVRDYFTARNFTAMFGEHCEIPTGDVLADMAAIVINNKLHCEF